MNLSEAIYKFQKMVGVDFNYGYPGKETLAAMGYNEDEIEELHRFYKSYYIYIGSKQEITRMIKRSKGRLLYGLMGII